ASKSASGELCPCSTDSVPTMWATTLCTHQPGSVVGVCHCCSDNPPSNTSKLSQVPNRPDNTSDLSRTVTLPMSPDARPRSGSGDHAYRYHRQHHADGLPTSHSLAQ